jgi:hypothetical protein
VNFYLVNDIMGNVDGGNFYSSVYLYKDKANPLLYMGPIWDFDISAGNVNYFAISNPTVPWMQTQAPWYKRLFTDADFKSDVTAQFNALKKNGIFANWLTSISEQQKALEQSQANNFSRWPMVGIPVWPNPEAAGSYDGEVSYMMTYIQLRIGYLDAMLNSKTATKTALNISDIASRAGSPVTLSAEVTGGSAPTGMVTFLVKSLAGPAASLDSSGKASISVNNLPVGTYNIIAVYNGDDKNALSASASTSVTVQSPLIKTTTSISGSSTAINAGDSITFTVAVIGTSGTAVPTGALTFTANSKPLGSATLSANGTATFTTAALPSGSDSVQAVYNGDSTYQTSSSPALTISTSGPTPIPTFALTSTGADVNLPAFTLTVSPQNGFNQPITCTCSAGLPAGDACVFSPATVTPGLAPVTTVMTISRSAQAAADHTGSSHPPLASWEKLAGGGIAFALLLWPVSRRRAWPFAAILLMIGAGLTITACGGSKQESTPQNYAIAVTATGGGVSQSTTLQVVLDN